MKKNIETKITPKEFEEQVKTWVQKAGGNLKSFTVDHLKTLEGDSGEYEIDVTAVFTIFEGAEIKVLIECKRYKSKRSINRIFSSSPHHVIVSQL
jgi:restriction system protein